MEPEKPVEAQEPSEPKAPPPAYVTREELTGWRDTILGTVRETITESLRAVRSENARTERPAAPVIEDVSDAEIEEAQREGRPLAPLISKRARAEAARAVAALKSESVDPLRATGEGVLPKLVARVIASELPHYKHAEVKKRMDAIMANLAQQNPQAAMDPDNVFQVYDLLIGRIQREDPKLYDEIMRADKEKALRAQTSPDVQVGGSTTRSTTGPGARPKKLEDVVDDTGALAELGRNVNGRPTGLSFEEFVAKIPPRDVIENGKRVRKRWTPEEYLAEMEHTGPTPLESE